jgi:GR25 family glycosyltransferase involved in LPS biosynthesis
MKCYWINLKKDTERAEKILSDFNSFQIENYRIEGIYHENPFIGCCLSHIKKIGRAHV